MLRLDICFSLFLQPHVIPNDNRVVMTVIPRVNSLIGTTSNIQGFELFGFEGLEDYYNHLSLGSLGKLGRVAVPLLSLHALDDPIVNSCTFAPYVEFAQRRQPKTPSDVQHHDDGEAAASSSNLFFLFTRRGGHVGWCEGWNPRWAGPDGAWGFQNRAVFEFVDAVLGYPCRSAAVVAGYKPRE